jgi:hypothetical protein
MALIEVYHVVAANHKVDATTTPDIPQGSLVTLNNTGQIKLCDGDSERALGIAGDSRSAGTTSYTPESGSALSRNPTTSMTGALVTGAFGAETRFTQNRVADNYNEVLASGKMTVYHSGGEFWTDQFETIWNNGTTVATYTEMAQLFCSGPEAAGSAGEPNVGGRFSDETSAIAQVVGFVLATPLNYPSGVPGTQTGFTTLPEGGNSLTWGSFLHLKLSI